jgi:sigma-E factor negative regulatory protein RseA
MKSDKTELSALFDGELDEDESRSIVAAAMRDDAKRQDWQTYALIGDVLRNDMVGRVGMGDRIMASIHSEPVVLAPRRVLAEKRNHPLLALAASLAGVAIVGWLALVGNTQTTVASNLLAAVSPAPTFVRLPNTAMKRPTINQPAVAFASAETSVDRSEMNELLLAHHIQTSTYRLPEGAENIRPASLTNAASQP